jgi:hypothetical protein
MYITRHACFAFLFADLEGATPKGKAPLQKQCTAKKNRYANVMHVILSSFRFVFIFPGA